MNTQITFYQSKLCPRCYVVGKYLQQFVSTDPSIDIEEVDVLSSPRRAWKDGIKMIPALKIGDQILGGLFLSKNAISEFIAQAKP